VSHFIPFFPQQHVFNQSLLEKTFEGLALTAWNFPLIVFHPFQMLGTAIINP